MTGETPNPLDMLRGIFADCQDVLSAPDVDRGMAALAQVVALAEAAQAWWLNKRPIGWDDHAHIDHPFVNLVGDAERQLAAALVPFAAHKDTNHA